MAPAPSDGDQLWSPVLPTATDAEPKSGAVKPLVMPPMTLVSPLPAETPGAPVVMPPVTIDPMLTATSPAAQSLTAPLTVSPQLVAPVSSGASSALAVPGGLKSPRTMALLVTGGVVLFALSFFAGYFWGWA